MTEEKAIGIAQKFLSENIKNFKTTLREARKLESQSDIWTVVFDWYDAEGNAYDGPIVVDVNENTGEAEFFS